MIDESDLVSSFSDRLRKPSDKIPFQVDQAGEVHVLMGVPVGEGNTIAVPDEPHIFMADRLGVNDSDHSLSLVLSEVPVLIGHGERRGGRWVFKNNQAVVDTVRSYNEWARLNNEPQIEFLAVCNEELSDPSGVRIGEFGEEDQNLTVAYAVGESVRVQGLIEPDGHTAVNVTAVNPIFNLKALEVSKQIKLVNE